MREDDHDQETLCGSYIKGEEITSQKLPQPNALCGRLL